MAAGDTCICEASDLFSVEHDQSSIFEYDAYPPVSYVAVGEASRPIPTPEITATVNDPDQEVPDRVALSDENTNTPFREGMWAFEWRPDVRVGLVKIPYGKIIQDQLNGSTEFTENQFYTNILTTPYEGYDAPNSYSSGKGLILPISASELVILEDVNLSRKLIMNTTVTQGTKYYQVFTENFPEITVGMAVVKFGGVSERVVKFFDAITTFLANPRQHPGSFYLYDVFKEQHDGYTPQLFYGNYYKRYKIIPRAISKAVTSRDNMMVRINLTGTVVEWEHNG